MQIHERKILHLDIKENNILINFNKDNQYKSDCAMLPIEFKLADFGIAKDLSSGKPNIFKSGTPKYMAPEQFHVS